MNKAYNLKISTDKPKIIAFKGEQLFRPKIEVNESILGQVKQFDYLGCVLSLTVNQTLTPPPHRPKYQQIPKNLRHY
jgi:hypothetical protein